VFGPVPRSQLTEYLREELRWGIDNADQRYALLNACRAAAFATDGVLLSKLDGGRWWLERMGAEHLIEEALVAQQEGRDLGSSTPAARSFVTERIQTL
jgi:streptomycin 3"-adenylyltransferase